MAKRNKSAMSCGGSKPPTTELATPASVLELILTWSAGRPDWQRDALRRLVLKAALDDADIAELVSLCKKEYGDTTIDISPVPLGKMHLPGGQSGPASVVLTSISDVVGVNRLAPAQSLDFASDGITVVYGDNGAGKSGYARILKRACRARQPGEIAGDAFAPNTQRPSAALAYSIDGTQQPPIHWRNEAQPHPILSAVNVFDRDSGTVHVRDKNEVAFRPFGLDVPDELAAACQRVKEVLLRQQADLERARDPVFAKPTWKHTTTVGKILSALTTDTAVAPLAKLADISEQEKSRHRQLIEDLAKDLHKAAREQHLFADDLHRLALQLERTGTDNSDQALDVLKSLSTNARSMRKAAEIAANNTFVTAHLNGVGGMVWRTLWVAAKRYSEEVAYVGKPFPAPGDDAVCLLCHQPLSEPARARLQGFDEFVNADTERQALKAEAALALARERFERQAVRTRDFAAIRKRIGLIDAGLGRSVLTFLASVRWRRRACKLALECNDPLALPAMAPNPSKEIVGLENRTRAYAQELEKATQEDGRVKLEAERDELADRIALGGLYEKAEAEIARLKTLALIAKCLPSTSTSQVTKLGNDIADQVITPKIRDCFQREIAGFADNRIHVEIVRSGGKFGSPQYQVRFLANTNARVHTVLSEGEQTCVALAAFLTELATATHKSALVFDDPVSSLDHRWRKRVAKRLVAEARQRQVIVFTHDLVFVHDLKDMAKETDTPAKVMTVSRGPTGAGVVSQGLPWQGTNIKDRVDKLEKEVREAKPFHDSHDEDAYRDQIFKIYNGLRSTWERAIEDVAFSSVIVRHRDYVNTKNLRKATALTEKDCDAFDIGFKKCCDQTDAHDQSRARGDESPPPNEVLGDVRAVLDWVNGIRKRQNNIN